MRSSTTTRRSQGKEKPGSGILCGVDERVHPFLFQWIVFVVELHVRARVPPRGHVFLPVRRWLGVCDGRTDGLPSSGAVSNDDGITLDGRSHPTIATFDGMGM